MASTSRRRVKRESTFGLMTPEKSVHSAHTRTISPKPEPIDLTEDLSDEFEAPPFPSNHGLPVEDEGYLSQVVKPQRRSTSISHPAPRPSPHPNHHSQAPTMRPLEPGGLEIVGRDAKRLIDTIEKLKKIGLQSVDTELPELVLVGDQSAGKSSLMGAIAEINLPKGQSMCTRCPTNIKTSQADAWHCVVSLQLSYEFQRSKKSGPFPGWVQREGTVVTKPFMIITRKSELENALKWAQVAILNPSHDVESFIPGSDEFLRRERLGYEADATPEARFSPNVISVEIYGPGLPDLSFYDLPGLFQVAEDKEQQYLVKVFENLTLKYIKHKNALIICTITMQNDPGLSRTKAIIGQNKAEDRCIGVLTMPDRLQQSDSAHRDYDNILKKRAFCLPLGYFVTKQPGANEKLDPTNYHAEARQNEEAFFDTDPLWREGGVWGNFRSQFGTAAIQKYLSKQFASLIWNSIPDLTQKISAQTREVDEQLALLPEVPHDRVQHIVRRELHEFSNRVSQLLDGGSTSIRNPFHSEWKTLCHQFLKATEVMRPGCSCKAKSDDQVEVIDLDDESEYASMTPSPVAVKRYHDGERQNNDKRVKGNSDNARAALNHHQSSGSQSFASTVKREDSMSRRVLQANPKRSVMFRNLNKGDFGPFYQPYLDSGSGALSITEIQRCIEINAFAGVPGFVNHRVREDYALRAIAAWDGPLNTFIDCTFQILRRAILSILEGVLEKYLHTELYRKSEKHVQKFLDEEEKLQRKLTEEFFITERTSLFTVNDDSFNRYKREAFEALSNQRRKNRLDCYVAKQIRNGVKINDEEKFRNAVTDQQLGNDMYSRELNVAAYIRGYYTTARIRFTDSVCANMNSKYFQTIKQKIPELLEKSLGLNDSGNSETICQILLEGNSEISAKRNALKLKKAQLLEFTRVLSQLHVEFNREDGDDFDDEILNDDAVNGVNHHWNPERSEATDGVEEQQDSITVDGSPSRPNGRHTSGGNSVGEE